jgi:hypothetical protein
MPGFRHRRQDQEKPTVPEFLLTHSRPERFWREHRQGEAGAVRRLPRARHADWRSGGVGGIARENLRFERKLSRQVRLRFPKAPLRKDLCSPGRVPRSPRCPATSPRWPAASPAPARPSRLRVRAARRAPRSRRTRSKADRPGRHLLFRPPRRPRLSGRAGATLLRLPAVADGPPGPRPAASRDANRGRIAKKRGRSRVPGIVAFWLECDLPEATDPRALQIAVAAGGCQVARACWLLRHRSRHLFEDRRYLIRSFCD